MKFSPYIRVTTPSRDAAWHRVAARLKALALEEEPSFELNTDKWRHLFSSRPNAGSYKEILILVDDESANFFTGKTTRFYLARGEQISYVTAIGAGFVGKFSHCQLLLIFLLLIASVSSQRRSQRLLHWTSARLGKHSKHTRLLKFLTENLMLTWKNQFNWTRSSRLRSKHRFFLINPLSHNSHRFSTLICAFNVNLNKNSQPMKGEICWCVKLLGRGLKRLVGMKGS